MKILLAGGGTAGHINPALAIAGYIKEKEPQTEILFIGNRDGMEQTLVTKAGFPIKSIVISGFKRNLKPQSIVHNIKTVSRVFTSSMKAKKLIKEFNPDICIGTGGYVSGPVIRTAANMGIPCIIHEQNAFPGVTTKMLSKKVKKVMLAVEDAKKHLDSDVNFVVTGNPIREDILKISKEEAREKLNLDERPVVLSFGGSLGARCINEAVAGLVVRSAKDQKYQHIHAYGQQGTWFPELVKEKGIDIKEYKNLDIRQYIDNMPLCLAACDLVVSRAGAITLSEIQAKGKPAVLIPSPYVAENHQFHNAMALVNKKAASIIEEKDLNEEKLIKAVDDMLLSSELLKEYSRNAFDMAITDASERIYKIVKEIVK
ncbi:MAG: undecaprenyldiphospho-muramoylpentapeptide beta-N-acetylglucosaminyltransferase [Ruminococcaceae bacterium]|nr:undecaprenyldiphospho-muramoylpentapeptide beta-N-acetylglucosaminyltransferase [Oscillospiraceae bacterium]